MKVTIYWIAFESDGYAHAEVYSTKEALDAARRGHIRNAMHAQPPATLEADWEAFCNQARLWGDCVNHGVSLVPIELPVIVQASCHSAIKSLTPAHNQDEQSAADLLREYVGQS